MKKLIFVLLFVFLLQYVSADCYYIYPAGKVTEVNGCPCGPYDYGCDCTDEKITYCANDLEGYNPQLQNYFKISNCECREEPVDMSNYESCYEFDYLPKYDRLNYYDFEETCSLNFGFVSGSGWRDWFGGEDPGAYAEFNNIPLYPSKCSPCVGNEFKRYTADYREALRDSCEDLSESKCKNTYYIDYLDYSSFPAPYFYPYWRLYDVVGDIQKLSFRDVLLKLGETKMQDYLHNAYGYQCIWDPDQGCKPYSLELEFITTENDEEFVKEHYTFQPCNPPMTCQWKCRRDYNTGFACLTSPQPKNGYPEALKQEGKYRDCVAGRSCYCENQKPVVRWVELYVDSEYVEKKGFKGEYGTYENDGKVREDDELICTATVRDEDAEKLNAYAYLWVNDGKNERRVAISKIQKFAYPDIISCSYEREDTFDCRVKFKPKNILGENARGKNISCEIVPFDEIQEGEASKSKGLIVAQYVFYAVPVNQESYGNIQEQYDYFVKLAEIDDKIELSSKLILLEGMVEIREEFIKARAYKAGRDLKTNAENRLERGSGDELDEKRDKVIGICTDAFASLRLHLSEPLFVTFECESDLAHELGHSYADYCDEYLFFDWLRQNKFLKKIGEKGCINDFPKCCYQSNLAFDCRIQEDNSCIGMPYAKDKTTRTDTYTPMGPYWSIMGYSDYLETIKYHVEGIFPPEDYDDLIYPLPSKCPLRGC